MPTFNVLSPIKWRGEIQTSGTIDLTEEQAAPLVQRNVLALADVPAQPKKAK